MLIVVTGASGFVGQQLVPLLIALGYEVLLVSRDPTKLSEIFPDLPVASMDDWSIGGAGADAILHLAVLNSDSSESLEKFESVNSELAGRLAHEARDAQVSKFVYVSTVHALDYSNHSSYAVSKRNGEREVFAKFGAGVQTIYLGAVHGSAFAGKLRLLSSVPQSLSAPLVPLVSAFAPTTEISLIAKHVDLLMKSKTSDRVVLTDSKQGNPVYRTWQASINALFVASVALALPLLALAWVAIVLSDGRPGLFRQERVGDGGRSFICFKFRTMKSGTPALGSHLVDSKSVFPLGKILRALNFDELPQALNILRGEMSLIGPRPSLLSQNKLITMRKEAGVLEILPGLTGWAQVNRVDMSNPEEVVRLDGEYLNLRSVSLDIKIILRTFLR